MNLRQRIAFVHILCSDYGDWAGAKKAVDEYIAHAGLRSFLHRIDGTGRLVKWCGSKLRSGMNCMSTKNDIRDAIAAAERTGLLLVID